MKQYIIVYRTTFSPIASILNSGLFNSKAEAEKAIQWHELKWDADAKLRAKFWDEPEMKDSIKWEIVPVVISETFYKN